jgi:general stress protein YciG
MKINVDYIETPVQEVKVSFKEAGRRGGLAKVPKGFAKMDVEKRKEIARKAAAKRWGNE